MDYKEVFESKYNRESWQKLLYNIFRSKAQFYIDPETVSVGGQLAKQALRLGEIKLSSSEIIAVYEVELSDKVDIVRNRRGIRDLLTSNWRDKGYVGAFVLSYRENESILRFSYVSETWNFNDEGEYRKTSTDTKRYTYLFGEGRPCRTAIQQFEKLRSSKLTLTDITSAFSVEALSKEFFENYKRHYESFVKHMVDNYQIRNDFADTNFDKTNMAEDVIREREEKPIRDYVKKLLGRIVFLHFLQKKGWLGVPMDKDWGDGDKDFMLHLFEKASDDQKNDFLDSVLEPLFADALDSNRSSEKDKFDTKVEGLREIRIPYLNGGLFERDELDKKSCSFPSKLFEELLVMLSQYNFTIDENDPNDAEVGIDPEMLGRIFENLLEDNKDKGAYYTPKEIVQYMCRESLIAYLQTDIASNDDKKRIRKFVLSHDVQDIDGIKEDIDKKLKDVKICDPAIGSGAFPMGLLKELFYCRTAIELDSNESAADIKRYIIQNNIYGVDIERGAVDIARLRFWLSLIVDEKSPITLPNLDYKIMQGNSLLEQWHGIDLCAFSSENKVAIQKNLFGEYEGRELTITFSKNDLVKDLQVILKKYFNEDRHEKKEEYRKQINENIHKQIAYNIKERLTHAEKIVNELSECSLTSKKIIAELTFQKSNVELYKCLLEELENLYIINDQFFLWHIWFSDVFSRPSKEGFDIVIGNPPYVEAKKLKYIASTLKGIYNTYSGTADLSVYFNELGLNLLRNDGILSFITTNKFFTTDYGEKVRELMLQQNINIILNFEQVEVFENILVSSVIFNLAKHEMKRNNQFVYERFYKLRYSDFRLQFTKVQDYFGLYSQDNLDEGAWSFANLQQLSLKEKIEKDCTKLKNVKGVNVYRGITTGYNSAFIINSKKREEFINDNLSSTRIIKNMLQGRNIRKWHYNESEEYLLQTGYDINIKQDYPQIYTYLLKYREELTNRADQGKKWYNLRACKYYLEFERDEKIIWGLTADKWAFTLDTNKHYLPSNSYILTSRTLPIRYILGLLNSQLLRFYFSFIGVMTAGGAYTLKAATIEALPIPSATIDKQQKIASLVENILNTKAQNNDADVSEMEKEIDNTVYSLYHLNQEDIKMVEGAIHQQGGIPARSSL